VLGQDRREHAWDNAAISMAAVVNSG
jgi:hypothetical protein